MIKEMKRAFRKGLKRKQTIGWNEYKNKVDFIENFFWQQSVRKANIKNI